jgi:hypothetical protein
MAAPPPHSMVPPVASGDVNIHTPSPIIRNPMAGPASNADDPPASSRPHPASDPMRAYRACLNCRNRKSKCDLDVNGGRPVSTCVSRKSRLPPVIWRDHVISGARCEPHMSPSFPARPPLPCVGSNTNCTTALPEVSTRSSGMCLGGEPSGWTTSTKEAEGRRRRHI